MLEYCLSTSPGVRTQAPKGIEIGMNSFPGIRSRDVLWCAQKRAHPTRFLNQLKLFKKNLLYVLK